MTATQIQPLAYRPVEAAQALGVSLRTLSQWTRDGRLRAVAVHPGRQRCPVLYARAELERFLSDGGAVVEPVGQTVQTRA